MTFTVSTKPLQDAVNLAIINSNVSKFYRKSCIVQITANKSALKLNVEASDIISSVELRGECDEDTTNTIFVDSLLFKQLVSTFDTNTVSINFEDNGITLISGSSKFSLPKLADGEDTAFDEPKNPSNVEADATYDIHKDIWKYTKDHQMYALASTLINPIYHRVFVGNDSGDIIVGDYDNSLFTYTTGGDIKDACLLSDTIINLFNNIPEDSKLYKFGTNYVIYSATDAYTFISEFIPRYESDEDVGSYNSEAVLGLMKTPDKFITLDVSEISKYLSQVGIIAKGPDVVTDFSVADGVVTLKTKNSSKKFNIGVSDVVFTTVFKTSLLQSVLSNYSNEVHIAPMTQEDDITGILVWNDKLTTVLGSVEE